MTKKDFQYGGWNSYTLQCGMWLWNRDREFTKWQQHSAMWYVALGWHAIEFAQTSAILKFYIWFTFPHITAVDMSFCTSLRNFIQIGPPSAELSFDCFWRLVHCWYTVGTVLVDMWRLVHQSWYTCNDWYHYTNSVPIVKNSQKTVKTAKMTIGVPIVTCLPRLYQPCTNSVPIVNKNLAIANRSRVSCANTLRASIGINITPWRWNLG